jgi:hypothetical protein
MAEEYILKLGDEVKLIEKDQWDGKIDLDIFGFIVLGQGICTEIIYDEKDKPVDIKKYPALIGITRSVERKEMGNVIIIYEYEKGKYTYDWIRVIRGALKYETMFLLKRKKVWDMLISAIITLPEYADYNEFKKIVKSIALGKVLYDDIKRIFILDIDPQINYKEYYYKLYKYVLDGKLDYNTYLRITEAQEDDLIDINPEYIEELQSKFESVYEKMRNNS